MKKISINESNKSKLSSYIKNRIKTLMESESAGNPTDLEMNKMVKDEKSSGSADAADATNVKMNKMDKESGSTGHVVMVAAGSQGEGGQAKAKKTIKSTTNNKSEEPFVDHATEKMNSMDKTDENAEAKTRVEASGDMGSNQDTNTGMKDAKFSEEAESSEEKEKRIAQGIQIQEGIKFSSKKELFDFINEQAKKIADIL